MFYWDGDNRFKPRTTVTILVTRGAARIDGRRGRADTRLRVTHVVSCRRRVAAVRDVAELVFYWDGDNRFKPRTTVTTRTGGVGAEYIVPRSSWKLANRRPLHHGELRCLWRSRLRFLRTLRRRAPAGPRTTLCASREGRRHGGALPRSARTTRSWCLRCCPKSPGQYVDSRAAIQSSR